MSRPQVVHARAALAGNPSDGFGGAVCSVIVPFMAATIRAVAPGQGSSIELVRATIERFQSWSGVEVDVALSFTTTIPQSVGLAGSSAIVVGGIRALAEHVGHDMTTDDVAHLAHTVERVDLAIAGGWQDQIVQSHGVSSLMDFGEARTVRPLRAPTGDPIPLYVAWSTAAAQDSGTTHADLRSGQPPSADHIDELRSLAHDAAIAVENRSIHDLKAAIDRTFDVRSAMMPLVPQHHEMVEIARSLGACANFAGSGGAIVGVVPKSSDTFMNEMRKTGMQITAWDHQ